MPRCITIYLEDADGQKDVPTGLHIDHGDGTATWLSAAQLDVTGPAPGKTWRQTLARFRDDGKPLQKFRAAEGKPAPSRAAFDANAVKPV